VPFCDAHILPVERCSFFSLPPRRAHPPLSLFFCWTLFLPSIQAVAGSQGSRRLPPTHPLRQPPYLPPRYMLERVSPCRDFPVFLQKTIDASAMSRAYFILLSLGVPPFFAKVLVCINCPFRSSTTLLFFLSARCFVELHSLRAIFLRISPTHSCGFSDGLIPLSPPVLWAQFSSARFFLLSCPILRLLLSLRHPDPQPIDELMLRFRFYHPPSPQPANQTFLARLMVAPLQRFLLKNDRRIVFSISDAFLPFLLSSLEDLFGIWRSIHVLTALIFGQPVNPPSSNGLGTDPQAFFFERRQNYSRQPFTSLLPFFGFPLGIPRPFLFPLADFPSRLEFF